MLTQLLLEAAQWGMACSMLQRLEAGRTQVALAYFYSPIVSVFERE